MTLVVLMKFASKEKRKGFMIKNYLYNQDLKKLMNLCKTKNLKLFTFWNKFKMHLLCGWLIYFVGVIGLNIYSIYRNNYVKNHYQNIISFLNL